MKLMKSLLPWVAGAAVVALPGTASADLIDNGGFELGTFSPNAHGNMQLTDGSTAIAGWVVTGGQAGDVAWISNANIFDVKAAGGDKFLDLTGYGNDTSVIAGGIKLVQNVAVTAGTYYTLTFDVSTSQTYDGGNSSIPRLQVTVNGVPAQDFFSPNKSIPDGPGKNHWETFSFSFQALDSTASVAFQGFNLGGDRLSTIGLDNVSLTAVPEASTVIAGALLLLPLGASALRILRRKSSS